MKKEHWGKIHINENEFAYVPKDWDVIKIKNHDLIEIQGSGITNFVGTKDYLSTESISDIDISEVADTITFEKRPARANLQPKINTIYIAKMKNTFKIILPDKEFCTKYILSTGFFGLFAKDINPKFLKYIAQSYYFNYKKDGFCMGTTQEAINNRWIREISLLMPLKSEQIFVADFLDNKTEKVSRIIENKKNQIKLLEEFKRTHINYKLNSGFCKENILTENINWVSELGSSWQIIKLKECLSESLTNGIFKTKNFFGTGTLLINVFDIYQSLIISEQGLERVQANENEVKKFKVKENDIFMTRSSLKEEGVAACAMIKDLTEPIVYECHLMKITPDSKKINPMYLLYYLHYFAKDMLISLSNTVTMTTLSQPKLNNLRLILPKKEKQDEIITYLEDFNSKLKRLIKNIKLDIIKLEEYKKILINDCVTGKMKVTA